MRTGSERNGGGKAERSDLPPAIAEAGTLRRPRGAGPLAPFAVRSFRFQWPADAFTSWAFEMETLILNWFVLVATDSVILQTLFASLQFIGTLISPLMGVMADRLGRRTMLCAMRGFYLLLALSLLGLGLGDMLTPANVFVVAALAGLVRPSDLVMRNALIGDTMDDARLTNAMGLSRATVDSARIAGSLLGASLLAQLGIGPAYAVVVAFYALALALSFGLGGRGARPAADASPLRDLLDGLAHVRRTPLLLAAMWLAFLVNLCGFPVSSGLLPYAAREVYGLGAVGLSHLLASYAAGALAGSLFMALGGGPKRSPVRFVFASVLVWYSLLIVFAHLTDKLAGMAVMLAIGVAQGGAMIALAVAILRRAEPRLRGCVMGVRALAVYGLAIGLPVGGLLIEGIGYSATVTAYGVLGLAATTAIAVRWRHALFAVAGSGRGGRNPAASPDKDEEYRT